MKNKLLIILGALLVISASCQRNRMIESTLSNNKIVEIGSILAEFNLLNRSTQDSITKKIKTGSLDGEEGDYIIILSLTDKTTKKFIPNAIVDIELTSPDNSTIKKETRHISGDDFVYYAAGFTMSEKGNYKVMATISTDSKGIMAMTDFNL
jgi:hypothetical protein